PRLANECIQYLIPLNCEIKEGASYITSRTSKSGLEVCSCVKNQLFQEHQQEFIIDNHDAICQFVTRAQPGQKIRLIKYAVFCDSIRYPDCRRQAEIEMKQALAVDLGELYKK
ncbi:MAG TPA: family 65 glycosyl hydrolase, partial [Syntrophomonas sp.]|nr:family 65 glycosyl hydrolase [Syntrophomonas sp.]